MNAIEVLKRKISAYEALYRNEDDCMGDEHYESDDIGLMYTTYDFDHWEPNPDSPAVLQEVTGENDIPIQLSYSLATESYRIEVMDTLIFEEKTELSKALAEMECCSWDDFYSWTVGKIQTFLV